ncbi:MAG: response regulator [Verrucomicrobiales bacterium]
MEEANNADSGRSDPKWEQLRNELSEMAERVGEHQWVDEEGDTPWIDEEELRAALVHAYSSGIDAKVILSCREACKSSAEFRDRLESVTRERLNRKRRILAVDDEGGFLELLKMNLEKTRRYEVRVETSAEQGLVALGEFDADLVITDIVMPGMDGPEFVNRVRANEATRTIPIIMLTALLDPETSQGVTRDGLLHLAKPIATKELVHCIEQHLDPSL